MTRDAGAVLLSGATGLVGGRLLPALLAAGRPVLALTRRPERADLPPGAEAVGWDGKQWPTPGLERAQAVVHLSGEPVFGGYPTSSRLQAIRESRVASTRALADALGTLAPQARPRVLVCASAVGIYGDRGDELLDEDAPPGEGFLADVCVDWEAAAARSGAHGLRVVQVRIGIVLAPEGGALPLMSLPFRFGVGGPLGDGKQWVPWVHVDDLVRLIQRCVDDEGVSGPVNAVAPDAVRNEVLTKALARQLHRPAFLRAPAFAIRLALGDLAGELLGSRRCVPRKAQAMGFDFLHPTLESALEEALGAR